MEPNLPFRVITLNHLRNFNFAGRLKMRVLATITLSASLMVAAPVLAGFGPAAENPVRSLNETIVSKTAPDGTWPFALKEDDKEPVLSYSI